MTDIEPVKDAPLATVTPTIETIIQAAVQGGRTGAELKELLDVYERMQGVKAKQAYMAALAAFQSNCPPIPRKQKADFATRDGRMTYDYASLDDIAAAIRPALKDSGLAYDWPSMVEEGGKITLICRVSHKDGHSETSTFCVPTSSKAGMSDQQKYASASTYAKRYALVAALGLSTVDFDDDGRGDAPPPTIDPVQRQHIEDLLHEVGNEAEIKRVRASIVRYIGTETIGDCPVDKYQAVVTKLQATLARKDGT